MMSGTRRCAALLLFLSLACADGGPDSRPVRVRVVLQPFLSHAPVLLADAEGYFSEQGLEVEFVRLADPVAGVPMLLEGGVDVLAGSASPGLLNAMARGQRVRAVAEKGSFRPRACSQHGLLIRRALLDAASNGPPAVRRISLDKQPQQLYLVERMLASVGLRLDAMEQLFIPHLPEMTALVDGTLDAALAGEPWITLNLENDTSVVLWVRAEDVVPDIQISFLYFGPRLLDVDRDVGTRFLIAYLKGVRQFEEGRTPHNLEVLARVTGDGREMIERMCWPAFSIDGRIDFRGLVGFQAWAMERGLIERQIPEELFWDPSLVEAAYRALESAPAAKAGNEE